MGEYVEIRSSPGDIIRAADAISDRGRSLVQTVAGIRQDILTSEDNPETLPRDQFTEEFLKHYHADVPNTNGDIVHANVAVQQSATFCGERLTVIGDTVNRAMTNYEATDDESGDGIARTV